MPQARSAALRAALVPILGLLAWGLTCVTIVPLDRRAVTERFGVPGRVLLPGLHVGLPWPLGTTSLVEYGAVHEIGLEPPSPFATAPIGAEDPPRASADRPADVTLVLASDTGKRQNVQSVSTDLRVFYRIGLADADALHAVYATSQPEALIRALAGQIVAQYFAARTEEAVLGAAGQAAAATLRTGLQAALNRHAAGIEVIGIVVQAIHPPAGAAEATYTMRAAEIAARTSVAVAHGAAAGDAAQSRQLAYDMTTVAQANAAEGVAHANANLIRFNADHAAARAGGQAFLLERYFAALGGALAGAPKTIIDHRLNWPEAPVLDLRPYAAPSRGTTGKEE